MKEGKSELIFCIFLKFIILYPLLLQSTYSVLSLVETQFVVWWKDACLGPLTEGRNFYRFIDLLVFLLLVLCYLYRSFTQLFTLIK